jgi:hypothetical protein
MMEKKKHEDDTVQKSTIKGTKSRTHDEFMAD